MTCNECGNPLAPARHPDAAKYPYREYCICLNERCQDHRVFVWRLRDPSPDERAGMDWWNGMTEAERGEWLTLSKGESVADAWVFFKKAELLRDVIALRCDDAGP